MLPSPDILQIPTAAFQTGSEAAHTPTVLSLTKILGQSTAFLWLLFICLLQPVLHQGLESTPIPSLVPSDIVSLPSAYLWALAGALGSRLGAGMCPHGLHWGHGLPGAFDLQRGTLVFGGGIFCFCSEVSSAEGWTPWLRAEQHRWGLNKRTEGWTL